MKKVIKFDELYSGAEIFLFANDGDIEENNWENGWSGHKITIWDGNNNVEFEFENFHWLDIKEKISNKPYQFIDTYMCVDEFGYEYELISSKYSGCLGTLYKKGEL